MEDISSREDIEYLITSFYSRAVNDDEIGHFFEEVISNNWDVHVHRIVDFWDSMLLGSNNYDGNPMIKHIDLHKRIPFNKSHFDRWITLWEVTVREHFDGAKADEAISRAKNIAEVMAMKVIGE